MGGIVREKRFQRLRVLWDDGVLRWAIFLGLVVVTLSVSIYWRGGSWTFDEKVKLIETTILALGLESLLLVASQNRATVVWNRLLSYHEYFQEMPPEARIRALVAAGDKLGFASCLRDLKPLDSTHVDAINADKDAILAIRAYLDDFEEFCAAVNAKIVDENYVYNIEGTRIIRASVVFEPMIRAFRHENRYTQCYLELQKLGDAWKKRREWEVERANHSRGVQHAT